MIEYEVDFGEYVKMYGVKKLNLKNEVEFYHKAFGCDAVCEPSNESKLLLTFNSKDVGLERFFNSIDKLSKVGLIFRELQI